ncbi:hypothetical protein [Pelotomaculum propionicicum]|uniref:N-acetyltransferase domain-containing protein n=1 Tax=Pelotomaculum propionicicum TaxID=258475 RepID=A0A4Y7RQG0_9FIRM|nr:hypothetical protein [Pelotomaculum propionicicum]NMB64005.1 hypothetical protein [Spirochaetota bacterium]TEB11056.1 hypothetical protein Pmgp_01928 [Pelotomaculum propionicicum]
MLIFDYIKRGFFVLIKEGPISFFRQFIKYLGNFFYVHKLYYLYEKKLEDETYKVKVKAKINEYELLIIKELTKYESLVENKYIFDGMIFKERLKKGTIAFCLFNNKELAHVSWVAFNEEGKKAIDFIPYNVNFKNNEVCTGAAFTSPMHRSKGLHRYTRTILYPYLRNRGIVRVLFTIDINNISSRKPMECFNPTIIAVLEYKKILWWSSTKEREVNLYEPSV